MRPEQLGTSGQCPHCGQQIRLPKTERAQVASGPERPAEPSSWLSNSISGLVSLLLHMGLLLLLAVVRYGDFAGAGLGEEVMIGQLPGIELNESQDQQLDATSAPQTSPQSDELESPPEIAPPIATAEAASDGEFALSPVSASSVGGGSFELGAVTIGGAAGGGGGWDGMLQSLRRNGLDIVITFDSTGSMGGEIRQVKEQIARIGGTLLKLIPKARISVCTYRDEGDDYVVRGLPLTSDIGLVQEFLAGVTAGGGGDHPEAVQEGLQWAVYENEFRPKARKVVLVFGDAPPRQKHRPTCLKLATEFYSRNQGIVSTVTCRNEKRLAEFVEIAQAGGGEAFLTTDERQIMTQVVVLVFGSEFRSKVVEAFRLLED